MLSKMPDTMRKLCEENHVPMGKLTGKSLGADGAWSTLGPRWRPSAWSGLPTLPSSPNEFMLPVGVDRCAAAFSSLATLALAL